MQNVNLTWSWLNVLTKKRYDALVQVFGSLEAALSELTPDMLKQLGCKEDTIHGAFNRLEEFDPTAYQKELEKRELAFISLEDDAYPAALRTLPDAPVFLYYRGDLSVLNQPCLGLVGTRAMTPYGQRITEEMVTACTQNQVVTVSGLAEGVDTVVAQETVRQGGHTVAVLGHGLSSIFPAANRKLADHIVASGGLLLSEYALDVPSSKHTFPARNRIIAGLSLGTVALEAGKGSGALITLDLALEYGRETFAVPGPIFEPTYHGCHEFISAGRAKLVSSPQDVLSEVGIVASSTQGTRQQPEDPTEGAIWNALTSMPQSISDLVESSGLDTGTVNATLTIMQLAGSAKSVSGQWVRG